MNRRFAKRWPSHLQRWGTRSRRRPATRRGSIGRSFATSGRMSYRPVPIGLLAGISVGTIGRELRLALPARSENRRCTQVSFDALEEIARNAFREAPLRARWKTNSSLARLPNVVSVVARTDGQSRLVTVDRGPELDCVLDAARRPMTRDELIAVLAAAGKIENGEAGGFVDELIAAQLLESAAQPELTSRDRAKRLAASLSAQGASAAAARVRALDLAAERINGSTLDTRAAWQPGLDISLFKPAPLEIPKAVTEELLRAVEATRVLTLRQSSAVLDRFCDAFTRRFEGRQVPLTEALDDVRGVPFPQENVDAPPLPDAFGALGRLATKDADALRRGEFSVLLDSAWGPSGATLLGRFVASDSHLETLVRAHLADEERQRPDCIYAELVHVLEGNQGHLIARPRLREHEIVYRATSGSAVERQLTIDDLHVSVRGNRITLRSARLGREVLPRLGAAHDFRGNALPIYRFLAELQGHGLASRVQFSWGALGSAAFLPRLHLGRSILALAHWRLGDEDLATLEGRESSLPEAVRRLRERRRLPRWICERDEDAALPVDLENPLCAEAFAQRARARGEAILVELSPIAMSSAFAAPKGDSRISSSYRSFARRLYLERKRVRLRTRARGCFRPAPSGSTRSSTRARRRTMLCCSSCVTGRALRARRATSRVGSSCAMTIRIRTCAFVFTFVLGGHQKPRRRSRTGLSRR